jgi:hypothetical protein
MTPAIDAVDVLVWGGGTGGAAAAIQAARAGASTLLLTPGAWLGGMVSAAGVCCPDGNELTPWQTGLWGSLLRALEQNEETGLDHNWVSCFGYRPTTAEAILQGWVAAEPHLQWWHGCTLLEVERQGDRITAVLVEHQGAPCRLACKVVIDGSDRGDLLPLAEAPFRLGWEAQEQWGEPSAPLRLRLDREDFFTTQPVQSPTWVVMAQLQSDAMPSRPMPLSPPFARASKAFGLERTITYGRLPGGLVMLNWPLHGNDWHHGLERAFAGDSRQQAELNAEMQAHSLRFATALEDASNGWLKLGEAFPHASGSSAPWLAAMPYWREGRRLQGRHTVIEQELLPMGPGETMAPLPVDDGGSLVSIAVGNYANDHHYPGADWPLAPKSCRWGGRWSGTPFCIPFGALLSREIVNLLAADKAFSTSHMANGATRLQPLILNIGQAAGAAAALAVASGQAPAALPVRLVQKRLIEDHHAPAAVAPLWDTPWHHPHWRQRQLAALDAPEKLSSNGLLRGSAAEPIWNLPSQRGEALFQGKLQRSAESSYQLLTQGGALWPVITLEPAVNRWLANQSNGATVTLIGCLNPWGPWLRITRLAG